MEHRTLGRTGLRVSPIGFGASPLGNEFGEISEAETTRAVHRAIYSDINFFDVSPYYGRTLAESRLGQALSGKRDKIVLATKCGRYDTNGFDFSADRVRLSIDESLRRLRTDYVDCSKRTISSSAIGNRSKKKRYRLCGRCRRAARPASLASRLTSLG